MVNPSDDGREENSSLDNTRRQFVVGSAGVVGGLAAGSALSGSAIAQEEPPEGEEPGAEFEDDVDILNYALILEYLEASFYQQGLDTISEEAFCNCEVLSEESALRDRFFQELRTIQAHEESHVETLTTAIQDLGGTPVEEPEFDFGVRVEYPVAFLGTAVMLEDIGVSAYAGAAPSIESEELLSAALGIHSTEARHASFLRTLMNRTSFPNVIDEARSRPDVLELAAPFIVGEPGEPEPPTETPTETPPSNGTETPTETPPSNGTETPTETPPGNVTETPTETPPGNVTETPTGSGTDTPTGNGTNSP